MSSSYECGSISKLLSSQPAKTKETGEENAIRTLQSVSSSLAVSSPSPALSDKKKSSKKGQKKKVKKTEKERVSKEKKNEKDVEEHDPIPQISEGAEVRKEEDASAVGEADRKVDKLFSNPQKSQFVPRSSAVRKVIPISMKLDAVVESQSDDDDDDDDDEIKEKEGGKERNGEESMDVDMAAAKREEILKKKKEEDASTVFVGNVPLQTKPRAIKSFFRSHGCENIESVRFRCIPVGAESKIPRRVAGITRTKLEAGGDSCVVYVRFSDASSAKIAVEKMNAQVFEGKHLRVDLVGRSDRAVPKKRGVFVGNLPFDVKDEELWEFFSICGPIVNVRVVRDRHTGVGKGFGIVEFSEDESVVDALRMNGRNLRPKWGIRISELQNQKQTLPSHARDQSFVPTKSRGQAWEVKKKRTTRHGERESRDDTEKSLHQRVQSIKRATQRGSGGKRTKNTYSSRGKRRQRDQRDSNFKTFKKRKI